MTRDSTTTSPPTSSIPDKGGLFVKVSGDPDAMKEQIRKALQPLMPGASYVTVTPIRDIIGEQTQPWRLGASMFVIFGFLALVLAAIGIYSVICLQREPAAA